MYNLKRLFILILMASFAITTNSFADGDDTNNGYAANTSLENKTENTTAFDWSEVMDAIIEVESGGNQYARGGSACGILQITPILVKECNQILKRQKSSKRYKLSDRFNIEKSKEMFLLIQSQYNPDNDIEHGIRLWNGGINYNSKKTQRYFNKVMSKID